MGSEMCIRDSWELVHQDWHEYKEQTPAEAFLAKWKGKKIRLPHWNDESWFMPVCEVIDSDDGPRVEGTDHLEWCGSYPIDHDWYEYQEQTPLPELPEELRIWGNDYHQKLSATINALLSEAKRIRSERGEV